MRPLLLLIFVLAGCQSNTANKNELSTTDIDQKSLVSLNTNRPDVFSFSRHDQVKMTHIDLNLEIKFKQKVLDGNVVITYEVINPKANQLTLDSRDLKIKRVEAMNNVKNNKLIWRKGDTIDGFGTELIIDIPSDHSPIKISYETKPEASGLQWLEPSQTSGKQHPYLFSQSQAIHARSWIPLQDTPSVRVTYNADIEIKPGLTVTMSADNNEQQATDGHHHFTMPQAIPAYLIAIAAGDIKHQKISEHVTIFAEQEVLQAAAYEFASTEDMITATESMYGPYRWGQYDLLILPPSFPFGGMENPKLSHITPTVIAGDRSLDSLIAHELAHSWSGNLVTNALWQDAWLNEGFTSYIEARIIDAIYGPDRMNMEATLAHQALLTELTELDGDAQKLINPTNSNDPDDYFSGVAYDKGRFFLEWMEQQVGRPAFDQFLNGYFDHFAFNSITTKQFEQYLDQHLLQKHPSKISKEQIRIWLNEPGLPSFFVPPTTHKFDVITDLVNSWESNKIKTSSIKTNEWSTQEWLHFLRTLPKELTTEQLTDLDQNFTLTTRQNSEIAHDWLLISIRNQYQPAYARLIEYLTEIGRVKLIKPLYEEMMKNTELHNLAKNIYQKARPGYHNIAIVQIDEILQPAKNDD